MPGLETTAGTVCASDAFFPFRDGLDVGRRGGRHRRDPARAASLRDEEVIAAADATGMAMVFTGTASLPPLGLSVR